jgi:hypothetical protein
MYTTTNDSEAISKKLFEKVSKSFGTFSNISAFYHLAKFDRNRCIGAGVNEGEAHTCHVMYRNPGSSLSTWLRTERT